jgi:acyl-CoA thioester hydrolase
MRDREGEHGGDGERQRAGGRAGDAVVIDIPVRWGDLDALGHVNNTVLFQYCESARIAFFEAIDLASFAPPAEVDRADAAGRSAPGRLGPGLVQADLSFRRQVRYPATVRVTLCATKIGERSFTLAYRLCDARDGGLYAEGSSVCVYVDYEAGRAVVLPDGLRTAIGRYLATGDAAGPS